MNIVETSLPDIKSFQPRVFRDSRGFFFESYNQKVFEQTLGIQDVFVQDNHSRSNKNVLRGLHYQISHPQGKLVRVSTGVVFDVAVDLRKNSPTFGKYAGTILSGDQPQILWIPPGFAHGFLVLSDFADFLYKTTDFYDAASERCIRWDDEDLAIEWPIDEPPLLSEKDQHGQKFKDAEKFP